MPRLFALPIALILVWSFSTLTEAAPRRPANAAWNVNFNPDGSDPSRYFGEWKGHSYFPSPADWRDVPIYQFITDRFADGDPTNNDGKYGGYNLYDVGARHGGDFRGIKKSLGYIKSLGFDGIWISPVFQNRFNSYHGYAQIDFTVLDDRFGTLEDFRDMVSEAHRLGMYVIVDIVANHMDNLYYFEGHEREGAPFRMHSGEYKLIPRNPGETYADFKVDNTFYPGGTYSDVYGYDGQKKVDAFGQGSYWMSDFHHNGDLQNYDDPWQNVLGKIYGIMDDLRTTHPRVQDKIIAMTKALISSTDIDGIRMDTPMQVPLYFFKRWAPAVKAHAKHLGKDNFFIFGEFYCPRTRAATMVGRGKTSDQWGDPNRFIDDTFTMDAGINYDFYFSFVGPAIKSQVGGVGNAMDQLRQDRRAYDFYNPARGTTQDTMLNFFDNHDQWRMGSEADGQEKTRLGSAIIAFWPGVPLFYYGDEQGFQTPGSALDGKSREDFMTSKAWYDLPTRAGANPAIRDSFDMTHPQYRYVQRLMNLRKQYYALRDTDEIYERWRQKDNTNGIFAFTRVWGDEKNWVLVAFNTWRAPLEAGGANGALYTGWREGDRIVNALDPKERYTIAKDGVLPSLWVGGYETKVFVREDNLQPLFPVVDAVTPAHDGRVERGEREIEVRFSEPMRAESVPGALRYDGKPVRGARVAEDGRSVSFRVVVDSGIHKIEVSADAVARNGKPLLAPFRSRFRSGGDRNPIANVQKDYLADSTLVTLEKRNGDRVAHFHHKAEGAEKVRVTVDGGKHWSAWREYRSETEAVIPRDITPVDASAQYWADGSAAYFSHASGAND